MPSEQTLLKGWHKKEVKKLYNDVDMKNSLLYVLVAILASINSVDAQGVAWGINRDFSEATSVSGITVWQGQSIFVSGPFSSISADSTGNGGYISCFTREGVELWSKKFFSTEDPVKILNVVDASGSVVITGFYDENMFSDDITLTGRGLFLIKLDANGNIIFSTTEQNAYARNIAVDADNNIYLVGTFRSDLDSSYSGYPIENGFLAKYSSEGVLLWAKNFYFPITPGLPFDFVIAEDASVYAVGPFGSTTFFNDSIQLTTSGGLDAYLAKYSSTGDLQWVKPIATGGNSEIPTALGLLPSGDIAVCGYINFGTSPVVTMFDSIPIYKSTQDLAEIFIARYSASGDCIWAKSAGGNGSDIPFDLTSTSTGIYLNGGVCSNGDSASFDGETFYSSGQKQMFVSAYEFNGNLRWVRAGNGGQNFAERIAVDDAEIYAGGTYTGNWTFSGLSFSGMYEMFLLKIQDDTFTTIGAKPQSEHFLQVYPNPSHNYFSLVYTTSSSKDPVQIVIRNVLGQTVYSSLGYPSNGMMKELIDLSGQSEGMYLIEIVDGGSRSTSKVLRN
jgi:hypothetical protein